MEQLIIENISKSFGKKQVLESVNLNIKPGLFGLLGPNGAGKTTLMRIISTILSPDSGEISMGNIHWQRDGAKVREMTGYLPQEFGVFRNVTARECLEYIAILKGSHEKNESQAN